MLKFVQIREKTAILKTFESLLPPLNIMNHPITDASLIILNKHFKGLETKKIKEQHAQYTQKKLLLFIQATIRKIL